MPMKKWIGLLALLTAFPALSTSMYLPAIPSLVRNWQEPLWFINLTLVGFFVVYSSFLLVYGPLSDRFGRRPLLKIGIVFYVFGSFLCALSPNAISLIAFRMIQAAGGASASSLALAVSRDVFDAREREKVLAYLGVVVALAPMLSPVIGGWIIARFSWQWIFVILGGMGLIALLGVHRMPETLRQTSKTPRTQFLSNYGHLIRNRRYMGLTLVVSLGSIPIFSFIAASSDIYITQIGLSEQVYGYFFGFNAMALMLGAFVCTRLNRLISSHDIITMGFIGLIIGGTWLILTPQHSPWDLALPMFVISFASGLSRPPSNNLVLEQVNRGAGAAASFLMFSLMTSGAAAMWFGSLGWNDKIQVLGIMGAGSGVTGLVCWLVMRKTSDL